MPNRLALEKSPYLLQHKDNPVDWRPWGPEAFSEAKTRDVPLLLSVGYSTCHWCHVMEHESFSDPAVAAAMNRDFVCVKLDREERPDVDRVYMTAVQAMTGQGGWPLNVFLTPELKPFFGGTYFPPSARWGQPGWVQLLARISELWKTRRKDIENDAGRLCEAVREHLGAGPGEAGGAQGPELLEKAVAAFRGAFDPENAGFGGAPKFPMPSYQRFLLRRAARGGHADARTLAVETLRAMTRGGIFDQVGGGFHRYSTDAEWRVPHFEKMLYDNAQLLENLADAVLATGDAELRRALVRSLDYLERDLRAPGGAFYSAEDADSEGEEGRFYLWSRAELDAVLGGDAAAFAARYGEGGGEEPPADLDPAAMDDAAAARARAALLAARAGRPRPSLDDKLLASWNGLVLSGLARAHRATGDARALALARGAADFLRRELASEDGRTLWHRWRDGERAVPGMAEDYAYVAQGLLDIYEEGLDPAHLAWAQDLAESALARFAEGGALRQTAAGDAPELFTRAVEDHDGVEPSPGAVLADVCLRLHELTGRPAPRAFADAALARAGAAMSARPLSSAFALSVLDRARGTPRVVVVAGADLPGGRELLAEARKGLRPDVLVAGFTAATKDALAALLPAVAAMPDAPRAAAYVCSGRACGAPVADARALARVLVGE